MPINPTLLDSSELLGVMSQMEETPSYWLDLHFRTTVNFDDEFIDFEKVSDVRKLAPFVAPAAQGRPIYTKGSTVQRFKPAYVKPKDAVVANRMIRRTSGNLLNPAMSLEERYDAVVADILRTHRNAIARREEWMAAQGIMDGKVSIVDEDYNERVVDFGRDPNLTVTLGTSWTTSSDIIGDIEAWRQRVRRARFGGATNRLTVGVEVWDVMRRNTELLKQLDTQIRGTTGQFITGVREGLDVEHVGRLSNSLDVYVYNDFYEDEAGNQVEMMDPKSLVLSGPNVNGVKAYGAILDTKSNFQALRMFSKMWEQEDPSSTFIMTQSAPLMIPVNPNNTLKATVLT